MNTGAIIAATIVDWLHLLATVSWIGGIFIIAFIVSPSVEESLEPPVRLRFMSSYIKRFRVMAFVSMGVLVITGVAMMLFDPQHAGIYGPDTTWGLFLMLKHIFVLILIILAIYILRVLLPGIEKAGSKGPSPEMAKLQNRQKTISIISFMVALLVLLFTAVTSVV